MVLRPCKHFHSERLLGQRGPLLVLRELGERELAERIVAEPSGEPLVVALAALGAPEDAAMRILLLGDAVSLDYKRLGALTRLKDALHPAAARRKR